MLDLQRRNQPQARPAVGEVPYNPRAVLYPLVETFETVGGADAASMALREDQAR